MKTVKVQFVNAKSLEFRTPVCQHFVKGKEVPLLVASKGEVYEVAESALPKLIETGYFTQVRPKNVQTQPVRVEAPVEKEVKATSKETVK